MTGGRGFGGRSGMGGGQQFNGVIGNLLRRRMQGGPTPEAAYFPYVPQPGMPNQPTVPQIGGHTLTRQNEDKPYMQPHDAYSTEAPMQNIYQGYPGMTPINTPRGGDTGVYRNSGGGTQGQFQRISDAVGRFRGMGGGPQQMGMGYGDTGSLAGILKRLLEARGGEY